MKTLYLIKRSSGRVESDLNVCRVEVVGGLEVAIPGKHNNFRDILFLEWVSFGKWEHYTYRTTKKNGEALKKAVKELVNPNGLTIDTQYTETVFDPFMCPNPKKVELSFRCSQIEKEVHATNYNYTKEDVLNVVNMYATDYYKNVVFVEDEATKIIDRIGGYREKEILKDCFFSIGSMWNDEHKLVVLNSRHVDEDGYRHTCEVDLVSKKIVG